MPSALLHDRSVDLSQVAEALKGKFRSHLPSGYLQGKTEIRDAVFDILDCSLLEAELVVDQLESRRMIEYEGDPTDAPVVLAGWTFPQSD